MDNTIWLSIGENCLTSNILRKFKLNAPSTIYSNSRCNINHVLQIEQGGYKNILDRKYLLKGKTHGNSDCIYSTIIKDLDLPFEFTHDSPLNVLSKIKLKNRINRMLELRKSSITKMLCYHHRSCAGFSPSFKSELINAVGTISAMYKNSFFFIFTQKIVNHETERNLTIDYAKNYAIVVFKSLHKWEGPKNIFADSDQDLFEQAIRDIKSFVTKNEPDLNI